MTTRFTLFDSPLFLGFDHFERTFDRIKKSTTDGYPPYNIEQIGENGIRITLAVAGFTMNDLDVEADQNQLIIRGRQSEEGDEARVFLHRGIAARQFMRSFVLADGVEILGASLDNGLLHIDLRRVEPQSNARKVPIVSNGRPTPAAITGPQTQKNTSGAVDAVPDTPAS